jgi:hypothetical protein
MYILRLCIRGPFLRFCAYTFQYSHRYSVVEVTVFLPWRVRVQARPKTRRKQHRERINMRSIIMTGIAALALGTALTAAPAFAQSRSAPTYSNVGPMSGAPLSPNGIGAAASSMGGPGPGYIGPQGGSKTTPANYSNVGPNSGAPLSPNGIGAAANSMGGPGDGYIGPKGGKGTPAPYSNSVKSGAPLSPNGIGAAASAYGGPGYNGN